MSPQVVEVQTDSSETEDFTREHPERHCLYCLVRSDVDTPEVSRIQTTPEPENNCPTFDPKGASPNLSPPLKGSTDIDAMSSDNDTGNDICPDCGHLGGCLGLRYCAA